ncbi:DNA repair protein XRCC2 homolog isoform X3 [Coffea eugenioides]|uniref:DNA repair protein XRCC2 homolog isoform X3 n=1 Tax=Coffea eugenioides TaxID=49369 RepID=UPI000F6143C0|nr:DNA repair protein XRCC2 homolog isoform X3 [Coffea eugenioides]
MESTVKDWIKADETAKEMLTRLFTERPFLPLPPPLHKLPLRPGNVIEVAGPPSSAKTHILMQAAISCILPKQWKGVQFGGMERLAVFVDLDCRFDVLRFSRLLKHKLIQANSNDMKSQTQYDEELFAECMRRFLYIRCYNSLEFLATLKTMNNQLQKQKDIQGVGVHLLVLDRKSLSLQSVMENVVQDLQKLLLVHPLLVLATKNSISGDKSTADELMRNTSSGPRPKHREYMPSVWQSFVTHRIHVAASEHDGDHRRQRTYLTEWILPSVNFSDRFVINEDGVSLIS